MKIAVISDVHGNLEALKAVISSLKGKRPDKIVCLGDLIGYGPDPEKVVQLIQELSCNSVLGNHEVALIEKSERKRLNFQAKDNNIATEKLLSAESIEFCKKLSRSLLLGDAMFVHGFPPDSVHRYVHKQSDDVLEKVFSAPDINFYFVGHTHELGMVCFEDGELVRSQLTEGVYVLRERAKYLINVGSVGQPRDGEKSAKYVLWDLGKNTLEVIYVPYDSRSTILKIKKRGFPEAYGLRLR